MLHVPIPILETHVPVPSSPKYIPQIYTRRHRGLVAYVCEPCDLSHHDIVRPVMSVKRFALARTLRVIPPAALDARVRSSHHDLPHKCVPRS
jgi:hypothetical protein